MIYDISYETLIGSKPLRIRFNEIDGIINIYDGSRYLTLFGTKIYNVIYSRIRYLINIKSGIAYIISHYLQKSKVFSYDFLFIEKKLTLNIVTTHIKSVVSKDKYHYYYKIFLENCLYQLPKK